MSYFVAATPKSNHVVLLITLHRRVSDFIQCSYPCTFICIHPILSYWSSLAVASTFGSFSLSWTVQPSFRLCMPCLCSCSLAADLRTAILSLRSRTVTNSALPLFPKLSNIYHFSSFLRPSPSFCCNLSSLFCSAPSCICLSAHLVTVFGTLLWPSLAPVALRPYLLTHFYYCHPLFLPLIFLSFVASRCRMECSILVM